VTVARLEAVKDIRTMVRAAAQVVATYPDFVLHVYGDGQDRAALEQLARELGLAAHVIFHGMTADSRTALAQGDVYLSSSTSEGISLTILEAMASGLPVVATAVGGSPELVHEGVNGYLVPPSDPARFAAAIIAALSDPVRRRAMGDASRQRAARDFSLGTMVEQYRSLYEGV
jgi:glycosyltransferase involved in cell wall biosynthesis